MVDIGKPGIVRAPNDVPEAAAQHMRNTVEPVIMNIG
jgi:hypothetical protein